MIFRRRKTGKYREKKRKIYKIIERKTATENEMELKNAIACRECHQWVKHTEWELFDLNCLNHLEFSVQLIAIVLNVLRNTQFLVSQHSNSTICNAADDDIIIINADNDKHIASHRIRMLKRKYLQNGKNHRNQSAWECIENLLSYGVY